MSVVGGCREHFGVAAPHQEHSWHLWLTLPPSLLVPGAAEAKGSSKLLSTLLWLCGMEHRQEAAEPLPKAEPPPVASLEEKPLVKHVLNINLLLCVCAGIFLWAYFA